MKELNPIIQELGSQTGYHDEDNSHGYGNWNNSYSYHLPFTLIQSYQEFNPAVKYTILKKVKKVLLFF